LAARNVVAAEVNGSGLQLSPPNALHHDPWRFNIE
jgi:hypothetical protein